ncbi:MAG: MBL fold metallo-hydrolase [Acidobacteriota bacterium]
MRQSGALPLLFRLLFLLELLLGVAHIFLPEYQWGQGRSSYFNFQNNLTLASWLATVQLLLGAVLALALFQEERRRRKGSLHTSWVWLAGAMAALILSAAEVTRFHRRLQLMGYPHLDLYEGLVVFPLLFGLLALFGWFLLARTNETARGCKYAAGWVICWGGELVSLVALQSTLSDAGWRAGFVLLAGLAHLLGCTFLVVAVGQCALRLRWGGEQVTAPPLSQIQPWPRRVPKRLLLVVAGISFVMIVLQIILFHLMVIVADYLTATSVISIALLGIAAGGIVAVVAVERAPLPTMIAAALLLPLSILLALGSAVSIPASAWLVPLSCSLPFACCGTIITLVLSRAQSHLVYCFDLLGAAAGALLVSAALHFLREETSLLLLGTLAFLLAGILVSLHLNRWQRRLNLLILAGFLSFAVASLLNLQLDWLNVVKARVKARYAQSEVLFSSSSLVGRYDLVRRNSRQRSLSAFENGHIIDTVRPYPTEAYQIDPRLPHTLMKDPTILILGLSGDGITKTSKQLGSKVYGVEINPAVVRLQTHELVPYNGNSYEGIEVSVMDGRSYLEQHDRLYDMITLMNAHSSRGRTGGRITSPEYLHTFEALQSYLRHLTARGVLIVEEPASRPRRELPIWKLLLTMRQVLLREGRGQPERHFFIFQWTTRRNNYIQILMKKNPFTDSEVGRLERWLWEVDHREELEASAAQRLGPISCRTTILHSPGRPFSTNYSRLARGDFGDKFPRASSLRPTTDDRPFPFDVDPARLRLKQAYGRALLLTLLLAPLFLALLMRFRATSRSFLPLALVVLLSGLAYVLVEVVLIQRYQIFLGSPVVAFSTVLGTLLLFSGLGSLWSGRLSTSGLARSLGLILLFLLAQPWVTPLFRLGAGLPLAGKIVLCVILLGPLAFLLGIPLPFALRLGKGRFKGAFAALLFALNAAASALSVPLSQYLSLWLGFKGTFQVATFLYALVGLSLLAAYRPRLRSPAAAGSLLVLVLLMVGPWLPGESPSPVHAGGHQYQVFALEYGRSLYSEARAIRGGSRRRAVSFGWMFWLIQGRGRTVLVDTGVEDPEVARLKGISGYTQPVKRLGQLSIIPSQVTDVVLTHGHWDHMGGLGSYRKARIWMQAREFHYAQSILSREHPSARGMKWEHLQQLLKAKEEGRLSLISGNGTLAPGIALVGDASHTPGSQYVRVETRDGAVVLAGDVAYQYQNIQWHRATGSAIDPAANLVSIANMARTAASPFFVIPGHDPRIMSRFPRISEGIVQIAALRD